MDAWREQVIVEDLDSEELQVILPPRDLGGRPARVITFDNAADGAALADVVIEFGPTAEGPWIAEEFEEGSDIPTLAAGSAAVYRVTRYDRWLQVSAKAEATEGHQCDLTVYLDAEPV